MEEIKYIDIDKLGKIYKDFDPDDITSIQIELEKIINEYNGIKYKEQLYKFNINRITDLLFDCAEDKKINDINIVYVDVNYVRLIADIIKYLYARFA